MIIKFLGAAQEVTGSCFYLEHKDTKMLIDCGMFQGEDSQKANREVFSFNPEDIDCIFITHAHLDHSGMLPKLVREGFRGKVITTSATRDLIELMLSDSAHIQESDAEWQTRKALREGKEAVYPLYTSEDVRSSLRLIHTKKYNSVCRVGRSIRYRFLDAGHILGSGTLELWFRNSQAEKKIVFSGDIGKKGSPIVRDPSTPGDADYVVMESTYGNRLHKSLQESVNELAEAISVTFRRGGNVFIPSFAVGRTQDLLYLLNGLVREGRLPRVHVYLDSPLAEEATKVYVAHPECFDKEARELFSLNDVDDAVVLHFVQSVKESMAINKKKSGIIVIAGSGMCDGGRIRHHLKHNLWRKECSLVFVGFQGKGTLGREIVDRARYVRILGEKIAVKASVYTINGFSAHADRDGLLEWLSAFRGSPEIFIVHGEQEAARLFSKHVRKRFGFTTYVPEKHEIFSLQ